MYTVLIVGSLLNNIRIVLFLLDQYCNIFRFTGNTVNAHISRIRSPISLLSIVRSVFYRVKACSVGLPQQFPHPQIPNRKSRDDQQPCKEHTPSRSSMPLQLLSLRCLRCRFHAPTCKFHQHCCISMSCNECVIGKSGLTPCKDPRARIHIP
jgi:hypothetical protein